MRAQGQHWEWWPEVGYECKCCPVGRSRKLWRALVASTLCTQTQITSVYCVKYRKFYCCTYIDHFYVVWCEISKTPCVTCKSLLCIVRWRRKSLCVVWLVSYTGDSSCVFAALPSLAASPPPRALRLQGVLAPDFLFSWRKFLGKSNRDKSEIGPIFTITKAQLWNLCIM